MMKYVQLGEYSTAVAVLGVPGAGGVQGAHFSVLGPQDLGWGHAHMR